MTVTERERARHLGVMAEVLHLSPTDVDAMTVLDWCTLAGYLADREG